MVLIQGFFADQRNYETSSSTQGKQLTSTILEDLSPNKIKTVASNFHLK